MPFQDVTLVPGVNTQLTFEENQAGISVSQLIRFKSGLSQKLGGWTTFFVNPISSTPVRDIHAFQGLQSNKFLAAGSLTNLIVISSGVLTDITPQTNDTTPTPSFSITAGSNVVTVVDPGSSVGQYFGVRFDTPIALGGQVLSSGYMVSQAVDANTWEFLADSISSATVSSGGTLPQFTTVANSAIIDVTFPSAAYFPIIGAFYPFRSPTTIGGLTIQGPYQVSLVVDSTHFKIQGANQATTSSGPLPMNGGKAGLHYYNTQGPPPLFAPYGSNNYGAGSYGTGVPQGAGQGTKIQVTDWSLDNSGEYLIAIPKNGPVYYWAPDTGFTTAQVVGTGPLFNTGGFMSMPQQILMTFGSVMNTGQQDPLMMRWSNSGDFTSWQVTPFTTAGSFRIPTGSLLIGGLQAPLFAVAWTDIDVWTATWAGQPLIWSWTRVGTGCGLLGQHAADVQNGVPFWAGQNNFYTMGQGGVTPLPCSVWDFFFQTLDRTNASKVRCASNSFFNEITWFFPVIGGNGENSAYVKLHMSESGNPEWDYGMLSRTAWVDTTVLGAPIGTDNLGNLLQHETSFDASGSPIDAFIETGYFAIGDGSDLAIVDFVLPDMKWTAGIPGTPETPNATLLFTFFAVDYPGDIERIYGPFTVTKATEFINTRMRGRFARVRIESNDLGSFWRIGKIKFRWGPAGRR